MKLLSALLIALAVCVGSLALAQGIRISQLPNTPTLQPTDLFVIERPGVTNKSIRFVQLQALMPGGSNQIVYSTNIYGDIITTNVYITSNLVVSNYIYSPTLVTTNVYVSSNVVVSNYVYSPTIVTTNVYVSSNVVVSNYVYSPTIITTNLFATNVITTNLITTNLYASYTYITNLLYFDTNAATFYTIATNASATTNLVVDMSQPVQYLSLSQSATLFQSTNRPAAGTNSTMSLLILDNFSGGNLTLNTNAAIGWKIDGTSFPYTLSNGVRHTFTFMACGTSETNVLLGAKWFK